MLLTHTNTSYVAVLLVLFFGISALGGAAAQDRNPARASDEAAVPNPASVSPKTVRTPVKAPKSWSPAAAFSWSAPNASSLFQKRANQQDELGNRGTEFWLLFQRNLTEVYNNAGDGIFVDVSSEFSTSGTLEIPGIGFSESFTVEPDSVTRIQLPDATTSDVTASVLTDGQAVDKGIHITASDPITVYGLDKIQNTTDGYLGLPTSILSTNYLVPSYTSLEDAGTGDEVQSQVAIVSPRDGNAVSITPSDSIKSGRGPGETFDVTLDKGEAYQIRASEADGDLTGTLIQSSLPVAVFSGSACSDVPVGFDACDHLIEQIPPTETWGSRFVVTPLAGREAGETFRILAGEAGTDITINGQTVTTLGFGDYYETILDSTAVIETSNPALVTQYMNGQQYYEVNSGDPFMMMIPPADQFGLQYAFSTPSSGFARNFISLTPPEDATGSIQLDGSTLGTDFFQPIPNSNFAAGADSIQPGTHSARSTANAAFGLYSYGVNDFNSYGFTGGLLLEFIAEAGGPDIARTDATANLSNTGQTNGQPLTIAATITKDEAPPVESATLFYRLEGNTEYIAREMTNVSGDRWEAEIPGESVQEPGIEYYILASDGFFQSTSPSIDPQGQPYSIAVLPNEPPSIEHTPVSVTPPGTPLTIKASVTDNTDQVSTVELQYRSAGGNPAYTTLEMQKEDGSYSATIPGTEVTEQGLEYLIRATDNFGVSATRGTPDQPIEVVVDVLGITLDRSSETPDQGSALTVTVSVPGEFAPTERRLFYRQVGKQDFQSTTLETVDDSTYEGTIPASAVTERGLQHYVRLSTGSFATTVPQGGAEAPRYVPVQTPRMTAGVSLDDSTRYQMISAPLRLDTTDVLAQLRDDFGGVDRTEWRLLRWDPQAGEYKEFTTKQNASDSDGGPLTPGRAYWLITRSGQTQEGRSTFDVGRGRSVPAAPIPIELQPGCNQVANPRPYSVAWSGVEGSGSVMDPVAYAPSATDSLDFNVEVLRPWKGYWVCNPNESVVQISVPPQEAGLQATQTARKGQASGAGAASDENALFGDAPMFDVQPAYALRLTARLERTGAPDLHDVQNVVGVAEAGRPGAGTEDVAEPPPIDDYLRLSVVEKTPGGRSVRLAGSLRPPSAEGQTWNLNVSTSGAGDAPHMVRGRLQARGTLPQDFERRLLDRDTGRRIPIERDGTFTLQLTDERPARHLRLVLGTEGFTQAQSENIRPSDTGLRAVYPNPSRGPVSVDYHLKKTQQVQVRVYDLLGRTVKTLVAGRRDVGHHTAHWNASNVASGVYFVRLKTESMSATQRVSVVH